MSGQGILIKQILKHFGSPGGGSNISKNRVPRLQSSVAIYRMNKKVTLPLTIPFNTPKQLIQLQLNIIHLLFNSTILVYQYSALFIIYRYD